MNLRIKIASLSARRSTHDEQILLVAWSERAASSNPPEAPIQVKKKPRQSGAGSGMWVSGLLDGGARPDSVCVRDGLAGWGGRIRTLESRDAREGSTKA